MEAGEGGPVVGRLKRGHDLHEASLVPVSVESAARWLPWTVSPLSDTGTSPSGADWTMTGGQTIGEIINLFEETLSFSGAMTACVAGLWTNPSKPARPVAMMGFERRPDITARASLPVSEPLRGLAGADSGAPQPRR